SGTQLALRGQPQHAPHANLRDRLQPLPQPAGDGPAEHVEADRVARPRHRRFQQAHGLGDPDPRRRGLGGPEVATSRALTGRLDGADQGGDGSRTKWDRSTGRSSPLALITRTGIWLIVESAARLPWAKSQFGVSV